MGVISIYDMERALDIIEKNSNPVAGPKYVTIDITNRCNLGCIGCWTYSPYVKKDVAWSKHELPFRLVKRTFEELAEMNVEEIRLTGGGEPLLHRSFLKIVRMAKDIGIRLSMTTNFTLADREMIDQLIENGIDNVTISVWAPDQETYDLTHPGSNNRFDKLKENIRYLVTNKDHTKIVLANVLTNINYHKVPEMIEFAETLGVEEVYFALIDPVEGSTDKLLLNTTQLEELRDILEGIRENILNYSVRIDNIDNLIRRLSGSRANIGHYDFNIAVNPCMIGFAFSRIMANGDVLPCCKSVTMPMGNLHHNTFGEIWQGKRQARFRKVALNIGKYPDIIAEIGCTKTCDNISQNLEMHGIVEKMLNSAEDFKEL